MLLRGVRNPEVPVDPSSPNGAVGVALALFAAAADCLVSGDDPGSSVAALVNFRHPDGPVSQNSASNALDAPCTGSEGRVCARRSHFPNYDDLHVWPGPPKRVCAGPGRTALINLQCSMDV